MDYPRLLGEGVLDSRTIEAVLERLRRRSKLSSSAAELLKGLRENPCEDLQFAASFATEMDFGTVCGTKPPEGDTANFQCGKELFKCVGDFVCQSTYGNCDGAAQGYTCPDKFDCSKMVYDCAAFACGKDGGTGTYSCDEKYDFLCGATHMCKKDFKCTGGHVYGCETVDYCEASFGCASTGDPKCNNDYSFPDGDGKDTTAGDFRCGYLGEQNSFDCEGTFTCTSKDEFDCSGKADFHCGNGDATDSFQCGAATRFECDSKNTCTNNFKCLGTYVPPPPPES